MNITVYLGALEGNDPALGNAVRELGTWIGESGNSLVYGGSKSGLMGQIAESVLNAGGKVTGVEPQFFIDSELQYDEITKLIVTKDMAERKAKMIELGDAFIAFPGGTGTLEEITEVMSIYFRLGCRILRNQNIIIPRRVLQCHNTGKHLGCAGICQRTLPVLFIEYSAGLSVHEDC